MTHLRPSPANLLVPLLLAASTPAQGPLSPPGPPAPMMKTLAQIEPRIPVTNAPFTIATPGSYYLTGDLIVTGATDGVIINAPNVSLDLNGFSIRGTTSGYWGLFVSTISINSAIRNGSISGWRRGSYGGVTVDAPGALLDNLILSGNDIGLRAARSARLRDCVAVSNRIGFDVGADCVIRDSAALANSSHGIIARTNSTIISSAASGNGGYGVYLVFGSLAQFVTANGNGMLDAVFRAGIRADRMNRIADCVVVGNGGVGLRLDEGNHVTGTVVATNESHGIQVVGPENQCRNNHVVRNGRWSTGGAGFSIQGQRNLVADNVIVGNATPLSLIGSAATNLIVRNMAYGNASNSVIGASQAYGPGVNSMGQVTNQNPWLNFGL